MGVPLKRKFLLMKPTHDGIIETKEVYIKQHFERYKRKLMLRNLSLSVYFYTSFSMASGKNEETCDIVFILIR